MLNVTPLSKKSKKKIPKDHVEYIKKFLSNMDSNYEIEVHSIYMHFCSWISRMESNLTSNIIFSTQNMKEYENTMNYRTKLLMSGYAKLY